MSILTFIAEDTKSTVLLAPQTTAAASEGYVKPTAGDLAIDVRTIASMGNAADVVISLQYADDAIGTNAAAFPVNVPVYVNGVRGADAKASTITAATGNFIVDFCVDPGHIPAGKFVGVGVALSDADNLVAAEAIEYTTEKLSR